MRYRPDNSGHKVTTGFLVLPIHAHALVNPSADPLDRSKWALEWRWLERATVEWERWNGTWCPVKFMD